MCSMATLCYAGTIRPGRGVITNQKQPTWDTPLRHSTFTICATALTLLQTLRCLMGIRMHTTGRHAPKGALVLIQSSWQMQVSLCINPGLHSKDGQLHPKRVQVGRTSHTYIIIHTGLCNFGDGDTGAMVMLNLVVTCSGVPGVCSSYADTLIAVNAALEDQGIPIKHFLLDSWWYGEGWNGGASLWEGGTSLSLVLCPSFSVPRPLSIVLCPSSSVHCSLSLVHCRKLSHCTIVICYFICMIPQAFVYDSFGRQSVSTTMHHAV